MTTLGKVHGHLLMLGTIVFLLVALFSTRLNLKECKMFQVFLWVYNIGIPVTTVMTLVRGITQVLNISLSNAADAAISGISGIGHIFTGVGMVLFLLSLRKTVED